MQNVHVWEFARDSKVFEVLGTKTDEKKAKQEIELVKEDQVVAVF